MQNIKPHQVKIMKWMLSVWGALCGIRFSQLKVAGKICSYTRTHIHMFRCESFFVPLNCIVEFYLYMHCVYILLQLKIKFDIPLINIVCAAPLDFKARIRICMHKTVNIEHKMGLNILRRHNTSFFLARNLKMLNEH